MMNDNHKKEITNGWDVLKTLVDGFFKLMSLSKIAAFAVFWYIARDIIFVLRLPSNYDYENHLLNIDFLEHLVNNDNILIIILVCVVAFWLVTSFGLIGYIILLKREIDRLCEVRSEAMHGTEKIKEHITSKG